MKKSVTEFDFFIYPGINDLKARATIEGGRVIRVRILSKVTAKQYHSILNDANIEANSINGTL